MDFVDLYAGAGGWTLGLELSGHRTALSAEIWAPANATRAWNLGRADPETDVRALDPASLPRVPLLVGSPPCTQFSYANKGGRGDMEDGMRDVRAFLSAVRAVRPRHWVMENVPRLCGVLRRGLAPGGALEEFADLFDHVDEFDMSDWGVPQRRRRCVAGRYPRSLLIALSRRIQPKTLGQVASDVARGVDPTWGWDAPSPTDADPGASLTWEEARTNSAKKADHPIYNAMAFPDRLDRPARTVMATSARVSRESIVLPDGRGGFRMPSIREAAALQSFPLAFEFASAAHTHRLRMAGNAVPPLFTHMLGLAVSGADPETFELPRQPFVPVRGRYPVPPLPPQASRRRDPSSGFRAAVPGLRFKSGMSFEMRGAGLRWEVVLNLGKAGGDYVTLSPGEVEAAAAGLHLPLPEGVEREMTAAAWSAAEDHPHHPYRVADRIGAAAADAAGRIGSAQAEAAVSRCLALAGVSSAKAMRNASAIAGGLVAAAAFNRSGREAAMAA